MKSINHLTFIGLAMSLVLTSCTIEKRVYMSGYHIEWKNGKQNSKKQGLANNSNKKDKNQTLPVIQSEKATNIFDNPFITPVSEDNITASVGNNYVIIPSQKLVEFDKKVNYKAAKENSISESKPAISNKKVLSTKLKEFKANSLSEEGDGSLALRILGWIIWAAGILILLFTSILGGLIICAVGILFMVLGKKKSTTSSHENKSEYVEVVYLKNGSIIRGIIIEQTPNVNLKIQTKDGSVYVYKMEDVEKITKEFTK